MQKHLLKVFISICALFFSCNGHPSLFTLGLKKTSGELFSLSEIQKNKYSVFVFLSPECPLSQKYTLPLKELEKKYTKVGIIFLGVFPGKHISDSSIVLFENEYDVDFVLLRDENLELTRNLNATITPEVFVLDSKGNVVYSGAIDNWFVELGKKREVVTERYLDNALNASIARKEIQIKKTSAVGCIIE